MLHIALLQDCESAEDETGGLHLDLHDTGEAEAGETLLALAGNKAQHGPGEEQGAIFPPLLTVNVVRAGPAVNRNIPAHLARLRRADSPKRTNKQQYYLGFGLHVNRYCI